MIEKTIWRNNLQITYNPNVKTHTNTQNPIYFNGFVGNETIRKCGQYIPLRHETAFFREADTLEYIVDYLIKTFPNIKTKKVLVGACSTGEEELSLRMLFGNKCNVKIKGFDLGTKAIKNANKSFYAISVPKDSPTENYVEYWGISAFGDSFLAFNKSKLSEKERHLRNLFHKHFREVDVETKEFGFWNRLKLCFQGLTDFYMMNMQSKYYRLVDSLKKLNCEYVEGDIRELEKVTQGEKYHAFTFRNAFYHLITTNDDYRSQLGPKRTRKILDGILPQINKALEMNGIFAIGKKEDEQVCDMILLTKMLKEYGFQKAVFGNKPYCHIWKKVREC